MSLTRPTLDLTPRRPIVASAYCKVHFLGRFIGTSHFYHAGAGRERGGPSTLWGASEIVLVIYWGGGGSEIKKNLGAGGGGGGV